MELSHILRDHSSRVTLDGRRNRGKTSVRTSAELLYGEYKIHTDANKFVGLNAQEGLSTYIHRMGHIDQGYVPWRGAAVAPCSNLNLQFRKKIIQMFST